MYLQNPLFKALGTIRIDGLVMICDFTSIFTIPVISGRSLDDNEKLCGMDSRVRLKVFLPPAGLEPRTARIANQLLTC